MKNRILMNGRLSPDLEASLAECYDLVELWQHKDPVAFLAREGAGITGLATSAPVGASGELIASLPDLRVISCRGVGLEKVDLAAARARGIQVSGTFGVLTDCVADLAWGLILDVARELSAADRFVRAGHWRREKYRLTTRVSGKRLGILGLGQIGKAIAKRAAGFDMQVRYSDVADAPGVAFVREADAASLARWADFLVVAVSGGPGTKHLVSAAVLEALGPEGFLVNVSRGTVVDQDALVNALADGIIAGAGLDVYAAEPEVPETLFARDNVVLLPHMASGTRETRKAMEDLVLANLEAFFATGKVLTPAP